MDWRKNPTEDNECCLWCTFNYFINLLFGEQKLKKINMQWIATNVVNIIESGGKLLSACSNSLIFKGS
jgi:hypothetical protein